MSQDGVADTKDRDDQELRPRRLIFDITDEEMEMEVVTGANTGDDGTASCTIPADPTMVREASASSSNLDTSYIAPFLAGKKLSLWGFEPKVESDLGDLIRGAGGEIIDKTFTDVVDFAVVPFNAQAKFSTRAKEIVSILWIEDCLDHDFLVDIEYFHRPVHPDVDSAKIGAGAVVSVTNYHGRKRQFIIGLAKSMGMAAEDFFTRKDKNGFARSTHLICSRPEGPKYEAAVRWNVPAVTEAWLLSCLREKTWVSEQPFLVGDSKVFTEGKPMPKDVEKFHPRPPDVEIPAASPIPRSKPGPSANAQISETPADESVPIVTLEKCLECPVCAKVPNCIPIYQCSRGHVLCTNCRAKISVCPTCMRPLGSKRNLLAEKILRNVPLKCSFAENGCPKRMSLTAVQYHSDICVYRDISCFSGLCAEKLPMGDLSDHLKTSHSPTRYSAADGEQVYVQLTLRDQDFAKTSSYGPWLLIFGETEFFLMLDHLHVYNIFQSWIYRCSFKENLKNSRCRIKFAGSESMIYEGPVISAEIQPLKVKMERLGLIVPSNAVRRSLVNQKILVSVQMIDP